MCLLYTVLKCCICLQQSILYLCEFAFRCIFICLYFFCISKCIFYGCPAFFGIFRTVETLDQAIMRDSPCFTMSMLFVCFSTSTVFSMSNLSEEDPT